MYVWQRRASSPKGTVKKSLRPKMKLTMAAAAASAPAAEEDDGSVKGPLRGRRPTRRVWLLLGALVAVLVLAIAVPLAVVLPRRARNMAPKASVIVPLYVYPAPGAWDPLHEAIRDHPEIDFTVVINPNDGPGTTSLPDDNYLRELPRFNERPNVRAVGYVPTGWTRRPVEDVLADINVYSRWSQENATARVEGAASGEGAPLAMHGIFFDETPTQYTADNATYLSTINRFVRESPGLEEPRMVIHNPGALPDPRFQGGDQLPDVTVIFEQTHATFAANETLRDALASSPYRRAHSCYMMHSLPDEKSFGVDKLKGVVKDLRRRAEYVFVTELDVDYYSSFGSRWKEFVDAMDD